MSTTLKPMNSGGGVRETANVPLMQDTADTPNESPLSGTTTLTVPDSATSVTLRCDAGTSTVQMKRGSDLVLGNITIGTVARTLEIAGCGDYGAQFPDQIVVTLGGGCTYVYFRFGCTKAEA